MCIFPKCDKSVVARGWCRKHYSRWYKHGDPSVVKEAGPITHGHSRRGRENPAYGNWVAMKQRCNNPNMINAYLYSERHVVVCERWANSFANFLADVGPRPSHKHSLDRYPDKLGNYEPGNVRWATPKQQSCNQTTNIMLTVGHVTKPLPEWCDDKKLKRSTVYGRLNRGWTHDEAILIPVSSYIRSARQRALKLQAEKSQ